MAEVFLRLIGRKKPKQLELHLIADNYSAHKHPDVQAWLLKHPRKPLEEAGCAK